jgi:cobyrinic acid a,c-diamide synthase
VRASANSSQKRLVIAGTSSGAGKTTITVALIAALRARGMAVQPFKVGPDYIDPSHHAAAAGRASRNLDSFFLTKPRLMECFQRATRDADVAIVEGVMGLYDGRGVTDGEGSTAEVAQWLDAPVILVVDGAKMARSAAAVVLGFQQLDPRVRIAGVVVNNVGSVRHAEMLRAAIESATGIPVVGALPRDPAIAMPERHLGLVLARELPPTDAWAGLAENYLAVDRLLAIADGAPALPEARVELFPAEPAPPRARIAIARDAAFAFYYEDTLDLLTAHGAELIPFSPLVDDRVPDAGAIYIGGGYPELHAGKLATNTSMIASIRRAVANGVPIYAECGGLMYLAEALVAPDGARHTMCGVIPGVSTMRPRPRLAYVEVEATRNALFLKEGVRLRGHEFHYSSLAESPANNAAYRVISPEEGVDGYASRNILASYVHLHFGVDPRLTPDFVALAAASPARRVTRP